LGEKKRMGGKKKISLVNENLTQEQRKESARKAGTASGKARKEKKELKEKLEIALDLINISVLKKTKDKESANILTETDILVLKLFKIVANRKQKSETVLKAIGMIWERLYGAPKQTIENKNQNFNIDIDLETVSPETLEILGNADPRKLAELLKSVDGNNNESS